MSNPSPSPEPPLRISLEKSLLPHGSTGELVMELIRSRPHLLPGVVLGSLARRGTLSTLLADRVSLDAEHLALRPEVLEALERERASGRSLILCTTEDVRIAEDVARRLGCFDAVVRESEPPEPLPGIPVRRHDHSGAMIRAMRPQQWAKNILVFVPLLTSHQLSDKSMLATALLGFLTFCLTASAVYVTNDLFDLRADRAHPSKRHRPFAAGELSISTGLGMILVLLAVAFGISGPLLPWRFTFLLGTYLGLTLLYSFYLKRKLVADVVCLASLYTMRVLAGAAACGIVTSAWLMAFSMFLFLSLAFVKRYVELQRMQKLGLEPGRRGYIPEDMELIMSVGPALGAICVLVLCLYVNSPDVLKLYKHPKALWLVCPLLFYWIMRIWFIAHRGKLNDDPVVFAVTDRKSLFVVALCLLIVVVGGYA